MNWIKFGHAARIASEGFRPIPATSSGSQSGVLADTRNAWQSLLVPTDNRSFHYAAVVGLAVLETVYFLIFFDPSSQRVDPGLMLVLAAECSFMFKIAKENLAEKRAFGATTRPRMLYTRIAGISLLALMAFSSGYIALPAAGALCIIASWIGGFGKAMWLRKRPDLPAAA